MCFERNIAPNTATIDPLSSSQESVYGIPRRAARRLMACCTEQIPYLIAAMNEASPQTVREVKLRAIRKRVLLLSPRQLEDVQTEIHYDGTRLRAARTKACLKHADLFEFSFFEVGL